MLLQLQRGKHRLKLLQLQRGDHFLKLLQLQRGDHVLNFLQLQRGEHRLKFLQLQPVDQTCWFSVHILLIFLYSALLYFFSFVKCHIICVDVCVVEHSENNLQNSLSVVHFVNDVTKLASCWISWQRCVEIYFLFYILKMMRQSLLPVEFPESDVSKFAFYFMF